MALLPIYRLGNFPGLRLSLLALLSVMFITLDIVLIVLPVLLAVAFVTLAERKGLGALQRRLGPDTVGVYGVLQPFADALKLTTKETVIPALASSWMLHSMPILALTCSILGYTVIPFGEGVAILDSGFGVLILLVLSGLTIYALVYTGWGSANAYALIGGVRAAAQMVSYELTLGAAVSAIAYLTGYLSLTAIVVTQSNVWLALLMLPIALAFHVAAIAETNRVPFDVPEGESEIVAGFITELSAMVFVLFFLSEYAALLLMGATTSTLFLGGFSLPFLGD